MRVLIVEDDEKSAHYLSRGLSEAGMVVDRAADGALGFALAVEGIYDAVVVDRLLPEMDGIALVTALRRFGLSVPVLMVSALGDPMDRVEGLRAGCDDYLAKPYVFGELLARLEAITRRSGGEADGPNLTVGDLTLNRPQRVALRAGSSIPLQLREFLLLQLLMKHAGAVVTRSMLIEAAWDYAFEPRGNVIDMHIHRLRKKIDHGFDTQLIHTISGVGYSLAPPAGTAAV